MSCQVAWDLWCPRRTTPPDAFARDDRFLITRAPNAWLCRPFCPCLRADRKAIAPTGKAPFCHPEGGRGLRGFGLAGLVIVC
jgi:hypothetical protein